MSIGKCLAFIKADAKFPAITDHVWHSIEAVARISAQFDGSCQHLYNAAATEVSSSSAGCVDDSVNYSNNIVS